MKEIAKNILGSIGFLSIVATIFYALFTNRIIELVIIWLSFFGLLHLVNYSVISKFSEVKQKQIKDFFNRNLTLTIILTFSTIFGTFFFGSRVIDGFTPIEVLADRLHERSKHKFSGSKCNDGWTSYSQGQGACSWHDGVRYEFYKGEYSKTLEECRLEAKEISWLK